MTLYEQWKTLKEQHPEHIVFMLLGDFYEAFDDDARIVSRVCEIPSMYRTMSGESHAMTGVPRSAIQQYSEKLVTSGYKIALAEMREQPRLFEATHD